MEPILISILYYFSVIGVCEILRSLVTRFAASGARGFLLDLIGTLQVCACVYENGLVVKYYGVRGFFSAVVGLVIAHSFLNRGANVTPCVSAEQALIGGEWRKALTTLVAQLGGGWLAFRLARFVWRLHLSLDHSSFFLDFPCTLTWKVPLLVHCAYEFGACFLIRSIVGRAAPSRRRYVAAVAQATALSCELMFVGPAGLNPIIAASRLIGCHGMDLQRHLILYWLSPIAGWLSAASLHTPAHVAQLKRD